MQFIQVIDQIQNYLTYEDIILLSSTYKAAFQFLARKRLRFVMWSSSSNLQQPSMVVEVKRLSSSLLTVPNLTHLAFSPTFEYPLHPGSIPNTVTHLILSKWFPQTFQKALPPNLVFLSLRTWKSHHSFHFEDGHELIRKKATQIVSNKRKPFDLEFLDTLSPTVASHDTWPSARYKLADYMFNNTERTKCALTLEHLPLSLTQLVLSGRFDQPVDNLLPPALTHLRFGHLFNHPVDALPPKLTHLLLGFRFDKPLTSLPITLRHLVLPYSSHHPLDIAYLTSLTFLHFSWCVVKIQSQAIKSLPPSLVHLSSIPYAMHRHRVHWNKSSSLPPPAPPTVSNFLPTLTYLRGLHVVQARLLEFTPNLTHLQIRGSNEGRTLPHQLPHTITHLSLDWCFLGSSHRFPSSLEQLSIGVGASGLYRWDKMKDLLKLTTLIVHIDQAPAWGVTEFFRPTSLPVNLTHLMLYFYEPGGITIKLNCPTLTHLTISTTYSDAINNTSLDPYNLQLDTPQLTHLDLRIPTHHLGFFWNHLLNTPKSLSNLTHLTLGKRAEATQNSPKQLKIHLTPTFQRLTHLCLRDPTIIRVGSFSSQLSHLSLGLYCSVGKKAGKLESLKHIFIHNNFPLNEAKMLRSRFPGAELVTQQVHTIIKDKNCTWIPFES